MQHGNWRLEEFPKTGWVRIGPPLDHGADRKNHKQCEMCRTAHYRRGFHLEHVGPPYRTLHVGEDCALVLTGGDPLVSLTFALGRAIVAGTA
jgi:hypothetical protein